MVYFVLWWLVSSVIWINLFLALLLEVPAAPVQAWDCLLSTASQDYRLKRAGLGTSELLALLVCGVLRTPSWLKGQAGHLAVSGVWLSQALHPDVRGGLLPMVTVLRLQTG